jgi:hypothetical protein
LITKEIEGGAHIAALVRDLMFASRVRGAAPAAAVTQRAEELPGLVGPETRLVIVELETEGGLEQIQRVKERAPGARLVAFGPHVQEEKLEAARGAGAEVMPRGQFVKRLPELVAMAGD